MVYQSGIGNVALLVCSVAGVAIVIERVWAAAAQRILPARSRYDRAGKAPAAGLKEKVQSAQRGATLGARRVGADRLGHTSMAKHENGRGGAGGGAAIGGRMERGLTSLALSRSWAVARVAGTSTVCCGCSGTWRRSGLSDRR